MVAVACSLSLREVDDRTWEEMDEGTCYEVTCWVPRKLCIHFSLHSYARDTPKSTGFNELRLE